MLLTMTLVAGGLVLGESRARGDLVITPTFDSSITGDANASAIEGVINQAIQVYQSTFTNNMNVNIKFSEMAGGLGQSDVRFVYGYSYTDFRNALQAGATSAADATALANLPGGDHNPVNGTLTIYLKSANVRALGLGDFSTAFNDGFVGDGEIGLNTLITDVGSPGGGGYSLLAVVEHEIDEVLGLGSSLRAGGVLSNPSPEDLFRYAADGNRSFTTATSNAYFSLDGTNFLTQFNNAPNGGDYGDWESSATPQVQDAFATPGSHPTLGTNEITALDVIGYNAVPEPSSVILTALGGLAASAFGWRRRGAVARG